jgi:hypothetical protein
MITQNSRIQLKHSTETGVIPTIPVSAEHIDGTWLPTDLYVGEIFINTADDVAWVRTDNGIIPLTGSTGSYIADYVSKSVGGTYSGPVYGTIFDANTLNGITINTNDINAGGTVTGGYFIGNGAGLTGINATWDGGTVNNFATFLGGAQFTNITVDSLNPTTPGPINVGTDLAITGDVDATGVITGVQFVGDGSLLTGITGMSNDYATGATLIGNTIQFNRTDLNNAFDVDLTSIAGPSITSIGWDDVINELSINLSDLTALQLSLATFGDTQFNGTVTADYFVGDGSGLTGLVTIPGGLSDVLAFGNTTGSNFITPDDGYGLYNQTIVGPYTINERILFNQNAGSLRIWNENETTSDETYIDLTPTNISLSASGGLITVLAGAIEITGDAGFSGINYATDYSANFVNRSLVDKEYVDTAVGGISLWQSAGTTDLTLTPTVGTNTIGVNSRYALVFGDLNNVDSDFSLVGGTLNTVGTDANNSNVLGASNTLGLGIYQTVIGRGNTGSGDHNFTIGKDHTNSGPYASVLGRENDNTGSYNFLSGYQNSSTAGTYTSILGRGNISTATYGFAVGYLNEISATGAIAMGVSNTASGIYSSAIGGLNNNASGNYSFSTGQSNLSSGQHAFTSGVLTQATGNYAAAFGSSTIAGGSYSFAVGRYSNASAYASIAMGESTIASGLYSSAIGGLNNDATGDYSTVLGGQNNVTSGQYSAIIGGVGNTNSGDYSVVLGGSGLNNNKDNTVKVPNLVATDYVTAEKQFIPSVNSGGVITGNTFEFDCDAGETQILDLAAATANSTITFVGQKAGKTYTIIVIQGSGTYDLTFPTGEYWLDTTAFDFSTLVDDERAIVTATFMGNDLYFAAKKLTAI